VPADAAVSLPAGREAGRGARWLRGRSRWTLLLLPAAALLVGVFVYPLASLLSESLNNAPNLDQYRALAESDVFRTVLGRTFLTAAIVSVVCLALGYPYAYAMTLATPKWRAVLLAIVLVPFWTSLMVRTFSWLVLLQDQGVINDGLEAIGIGRQALIRNTAGVTVGMAQVMLPFAVLPMYAVMQKIDRRLLLAAEGCGARPAAAFARIYVPLSLPGVAAGLSLVFILSLGFFITPQLLGSPANALISQLMYTEITQLGNFEYGAAMGFVLLAATILLLALVQTVLRASSSPPRTGGAVG
jgi:putative spermidine/putrescine transport system permease protein